MVHLVGSYRHSKLAGTVRRDHIERHCYDSHAGVNLSRFLALGPLLDPDAAHDREGFGSLPASAVG